MAVSRADDFADRRGAGVYVSAGQEWHEKRNGKKTQSSHQRLTMKGVQRSEDATRHTVGLCPLCTEESVSRRRAYFSDITYIIGQNDKRLKVL